MNFVDGIREPTKRTKHIDVKFHFIRQHIEEGRVNVIYSPTKDMIADCLTKPVGKIILEKCKAKIFGLHCGSIEGGC